MHGVERLAPPPPPPALWDPALRDPALWDLWDPALWDLAPVVEATTGVDTATAPRCCFSRQGEEQTTGDPGRCRRLENPVCFCGGRVRKL